MSYKTVTRKLLKRVVFTEGRWGCNQEWRWRHGRDSTSLLGAADGRLPLPWSPMAGKLPPVSSNGRSKWAKSAAQIWGSLLLLDFDYICQSWCKFWIWCWCHGTHKYLMIFVLLKAFLIEDVKISDFENVTKILRWRCRGFWDPRGEWADWRGRSSWCRRPWGRSPARWELFLGNKYLFFCNKSLFCTRCPGRVTSLCLWRRRACWRHRMGPNR